MGKVRSVEYDAGVKTKYIQESNGQLTIKSTDSKNKTIDILVFYTGS